MSEYKFNAIDVKDECVQWIRDWFDKNGNGCRAVVGISGGKDSSVVAALCVEALGKDSVIGVMMPNISPIVQNNADNAIAELLNTRKNLGLKKNSGEVFKTVDKYESAIRALNDGYKLCSFLEIEHFVINIYDAVTAISREVDTRYSLTDQARINLQPRIRMSTLYTVSQSVNGRVANTSNLSEIFLGYGTRWGDTVGDFAPLANLTCTEVKKIGKVLSLPDYFVNRIPDDGLCGKSDEESFGFTYAEVDSYIRGENVPYDRAASIVSAIDSMHEKSEFKRKPIVSFVPSI